MYNQSLKHKWDNENVMDYAIKTAVKEAVKEAVTEADQKAREEERAKAEKEKKELARQMLADKFPIDQIAKYTKLSIDEIKAL